jgi:phospholipid/cholesterol/gamma-HCH transport system substrate-binding protein
MDRDANYVAVGAFVLLILGLAAVFVLWYTNARDRREYQRYEVYFEGSVSGLNEGSTVRYLGVNVGRVAEIRLDARDPKRVQVIVDLDSSTPINPTTTARLSLQGVTGLLFIDLAQDTLETARLPAVASEHYPVIRSVKSDFDRFVSGLPEAVAKATEAANRFTLMLSPENLAAVSATLANIKVASDSLPATTRDASVLVRDLRVMVAELRESAAAIRTATATAGPDLAATAARARIVADNLASATGRLDEFLTAHQEDLDRFSGQGLLEAERLLRDSRQAAREFRELSRSLKQNPSQILYEPQYSGVEIPR